MKDMAGFFKKNDKKKQQTLSLWESVSSSFTNIKYDLTKNFFELREKLFEDPSDLKNINIVIQGKNYSNRSQAKKAVKEILWFSYRKGFNIMDAYKSDVGWGCLVRVGQMALGSALRKFFQTQNSLNGIGFDNTIENIITAFNDTQGSQQKYSLNKIIEIANQQFQVKVGQWFNLSVISQCLKITQNKYPMKGAQNLEVVFFDQMINIPTIFKIELIKQCVCTKKFISCQKCHVHINLAMGKQQVLVKNKENHFESLSNIEEMNHSFTKRHGSYFQDEKKQVYQTGGKRPVYSLQIFKTARFKRDLIVFVLTRIGNTQKEDKIKGAIFTLLDLSTCLGIMTGFPGQAIFIVGRQEEKLIYLNPHYVQDHIGFSSTSKQSYFCQEYLLTERSLLDPSMVFCFYIQTISELETITEAIEKIHLYYPDSLSLGFDFSKPYFNPSDYEQVEEDSQTSIYSFLV